MKRLIPVIVSFVFAVIAVASYAIHSSQWSEQLKLQEAKLQNAGAINLQDENLSEKESTEQEQSEKIEAVASLDITRVEKDDKIAADFLEKIMTWDSYAEYEGIRQELMSTYGLSEDSNFLTVFMPEVVTKTSKDGTVYNRIDVMGLNVTYEGMDSYVAGITGQVYSYFAFVEWSSHDKNGAEASAKCIFMYSINGEGKLLNLDAYTIAN